MIVSGPPPAEQNYPNGVNLYPSARTDPAATENARRYRPISAAGLALGALGIAMQAISHPERFPLLPPGLVILGLASVCVLVVPGRWIPVGGVLAGPLALLNVVDPEHPDVLIGASGLDLAVGKWMVLIGGGIGLIGAALALIGEARARSRAAAATEAAAAPPGDRSASAAASAAARESRWARRLQVAGLLVLAPICAEYLTAYDSTTGDPAQLLGGLIIFVPLYGAPALLIREVARRRNRGWSGMLLLAAAFGLAQAGLVDQSLFNEDYRDIEAWDEINEGTYLPALGLSAYNILNFIGGHMIYSIGAPIAIIEALHPPTGHRPWLRPRALILIGGLYLAASALVLDDTLNTESARLSGGQLIGSIALVTVLLLAGLAGRQRFRRPQFRRLQFRSPKTHPATASPGLPDRTGLPGRIGERLPSPRSVVLLALPIAVINSAAAPTWTGVVVVTIALGLAGLVVGRAAGRPGWNLHHVAALAAAALLARAALAFSYFPLIGDVSAGPKYAHNVVLAILMLAVCVPAVRSPAD